MSYFITAAQEIISEEGIAGVNIRNVAARAGYQPSTLYNYFADMDELLAFAATKYLSDYLTDLDKLTNGIEDPVRSFCVGMECWCRHCFAQSELFRVLYFDKHRDNLDYIVNTYYSVFPNELGEANSPASILRSGKTFEERSLIYYEPLVQAGLLTAGVAKMINRLLCGYNQSLLYENIAKPEPETNIKRMADAIQFLFTSYNLSYDAQPAKE